MNNQDRAGGEREAPMYFEAVSVDKELPDNAGNYHIIDQLEDKQIIYTAWFDTSLRLFLSGNIQPDFWLRPIALTTLQGEVERLRKALEWIATVCEEADEEYSHTLPHRIHTIVNQALNPTPHER